VGCVQARVNEWSLSTLPSPIPKLQHTPLPLKVLWTRERAPTPPPSAVLYLDSLLSLARSWECVKKCLQNACFNSLNMQLGWSCTKFLPHFKMLFHKMKPNKLMILASIVSPLARIAFLKILMWASRSIFFMYVGYWNFWYENLLVGLDELEPINTTVTWISLDQVFAFHKI